MSGRRILLLLTVIISFVLTASPVYVATAQAACLNRVAWVFLSPDLCLQTVVEVPTAPGVISIAGLDFTPDGLLYFTRPAANAVWRAHLLADGTLSGPEPFATELPEMPFGLSYDSESAAWYVSADTMLYRLRDLDTDGTADEVTILVRDLPGGAGGWLGDVRIGTDRRLYVAKSSTCADCQETDPRRAALLSFALDGSDPRIVATGLNDAFSFDWTPDGTLYIVDNVLPSQPAELNVLLLGTANINFREAAPLLTFDPASHPTGIVYYENMRFPTFPRGFFIAFAGSWNNTAVTGHEVIFVRLNEQNKVIGVERPIPTSPRRTVDASLIKTSLHPYRPYDLAVGTDGWLYIAIAEGRIYRFRPL